MGVAWSTYEECKSPKGQGILVGTAVLPAGHAAVWWAEDCTLSLLAACGRGLCSGCAAAGPRGTVLPLINSHCPYPGTGSGSSMPAHV